MSGKRLVSRAWSWRHAIARSGLPPTTRHILLTLSIYMDEAGGSCFPKVEDLVEATGLSKRAVLMHLAAACDAGWLRRALHGYRGQRWRQLEYEPLWPEREVDPPEHDAAGEPATVSPEAGAEAGAPDAPASEKLVHDDHEAGAPGAPKLVHDVHQDRDHSIHQSITSPENERERRGREPGKGSPAPERGRDPMAPAGAALLARLKRMHPGSAQEDPDAVAALWAGLGEADRQAAVERHGDWMEDGRAAGRKVVPKLAFYLAKALWTGLADKAAGPAAAAAAAARIGAFDRAWWWLFFDFVALHLATIGQRDTLAARELRKRVELALSAAAIGWQVASEAVAGIEADAMRLVKAEVDGAVFTAWRRRLAGLGVELPRPDRTHWVYLPAGDPEAWPVAAHGEEGEAGDAMRQTEAAE